MTKTEAENCSDIKLSHLIQVMKNNAGGMHKKEMPTEWRSVSSSLYNN